MLAVSSNFPKYQIPGNLIITTLDKESGFKTAFKYSHFFLLKETS